MVGLGVGRGVAKSASKVHDGAPERETLLCLSLRLHLNLGSKSRSMSGRGDWLLLDMASDGHHDSEMANEGR